MAVDSQLADAARGLLFQTADALHEEFVEVGGGDGEKLDSFERRIPLVLPPPGAPDTAAAAMLAALPSDFGTAARRDGTDLGSNNWAVAPARTRGRDALLAGDPHLDLTLPSIWYEAHIVVPGVMDAYGITIPGLPAIVIGFNRDVAWTFTNVEADLMDYWAERVDDPARPRRYLLDGVWRPLEFESGMRRSICAQAKSSRSK